LAGALVAGFSVVAGALVVGAFALLSSMTFALRATDLCLLLRLRSLDFGRCSLCMAAPCCLLACLLLILSFVKFEIADVPY